MSTVTYPNALSACFDHAGRELVESWQDELEPRAAEQIAREYLIARVEVGDLYAVTFRFTNGRTEATEGTETTVTE